MIRPDEVSQTVLAILSLQSFYALILFPLIWGAVKCCRGRYGRLQHGLWLLILLRLLMPPDMATSWSAGHLVRSVLPPMASAQFLAFPYDAFTIKTHQKPFAPVLSDDHRPGDRHPAAQAPTLDSRQATPFSTAVLKWCCIAVCCAYFAAVIRLLKLFYRIRRRFWKIARQAKPLQDPAVITILRTWRKRLQIRRPVAVKVADSDVPSYTMGFFRPVVVIPQYLVSSAGSAGLEAVLAHELVHVKHWDDLAICLQELVRIAYFFHPLVWFVMPRLNWTREAVCDATVLSHATFSPGIYGKQLLCLGRGHAFAAPSPTALAVFTPAAKAMAFRLNYIQKEEHMKSNPIIVYLTVLIVGVFLLPMAPVASSGQGITTDKAPLSQIQGQDRQQNAKHVLTQYVMQCAPCQNPQEVAHIVWGDFLAGDFQEGDLSRLVSATDCDVVDNVGDGQKAYVFYLLSNSRKGVYRPNFHFIMEQHQLKLLFKSRNLATYATDRATVNGRYEIEEGWRADFVDGVDDERVNLSWGSSVWFWSGTRYLKAYTEYTIQEATDPSLIGTKRKWEQKNRSVYEEASRQQK